MISQIFTIARFTIVRIIRDRKSLMLMFLMPILLILILGNALDKLFDVDNINITRVAYLNDDKGSISKTFDEFLKMDEISRVLEIVPVLQYDNGVDMIKKNEVKVFIFIDKDFSSQTMEGRGAQIKVIGEKSDIINSSIVQNIVDSYIKGANTYAAMSRISNPTELVHYQVLKEEPLAAKGKIPRAMDYYAVTMLVLIIMYAAQYAVYGISEDYLEKMSSRLKSTPVPTGVHLTGKIIGMVFTVYCQIVILIMFTKYIYGANWGNDMPKILFIAFTLAVFAIALGTMMATIAKEAKIAGAILGVIIPIMTFISGGYMKIVSDNKVYLAVKFILPTNLGQSAFFNTVYEGSSSQSNIYILTIWCVTTVLCIVAGMAGRRRLI